jgi:hypothetical protein|tara:strand:+ start:291 stop:437 length:147 start_codon:yes stop_codon:yes gene_type:complete
MWKNTPKNRQPDGTATTLGTLKKKSLLGLGPKKVPITFRAGKHYQAMV